MGAIAYTITYLDMASEMDIIAAPPPYADAPEPIPISRSPPRHPRYRVNSTATTITLIAIATLTTYSWYVGSNILFGLLFLESHGDLFIIRMIAPVPKILGHVLNMSITKVGNQWHPHRIIIATLFISAFCWVKLLTTLYVVNISGEETIVIVSVVLFQIISGFLESATMALAAEFSYACINKVLIGINVGTLLIAAMLMVDVNTWALTDTVIFGLCGVTVIGLTLYYIDTDLKIRDYVTRKKQEIERSDKVFFSNPLPTDTPPASYNILGHVIVRSRAFLAVALFVAITNAFNFPGLLLRYHSHLLIHQALALLIYATMAILGNLISGYISIGRRALYLFATLYCIIVTLVVGGFSLKVTQTAIGIHLVTDILHIITLASCGLTWGMLSSSIYKTIFGDWKLISYHKPITGQITMQIVVKVTAFFFVLGSIIGLILSNLFELFNKNY
jgi:hypothetical protein